MLDLFGQLLDAALSERVAVSQGFDNVLMRQAIDFFQLQRPASQLIIIAGSNGKGTCAHVLSQWLQKSGRRVGLITSPHICHYQERYLYNNQQLPLSVWNEIYHQIARFESYQALSFFELVVLAGFLLARYNKVDVLISEVGLGGRHDATNVISHDVALLTTVDLEHTQVLGDTREQILAEKIQVTRPGSYLVSALDGLEGALAKWQTEIGFKRVSVPESAPRVKGINPRLLACCAAVMTQVVGSDSWQNDPVYQHTKVPFRSMVIGPGPTLVDTAHNEAAVRYLLKLLSADYGVSRWRVVFNVRADRDIYAFYKALQDWQCDVYLLDVKGCHKRQDLASELSALRWISKGQLSRFIEDQEPLLIVGSFLVLENLLGGSLQNLFSSIILNEQFIGD